MPDDMPDIKCKTCDVGTLQRVVRYRMSGIVVAIGYILLIPCVIGLVFSAFMFLGTLGLSTSASVAAADSGASTTAGMLVGGIFVFLGVLSLVGGLLGWLLVMKKKVLQCNYCGAVVAAS